VLVSGAQLFTLSICALPVVRISSPYRLFVRDLQSLWFGGGGAPGAHGRIKPKEPSQSINDPDRPLYITLYKNFAPPQKIIKSLKYYIILKKVIYNT